MLCLKAFVEPAGKISHRFDHDVFGIFCGELPVCVVTLDGDGHAVFMVGSLIKLNRVRGFDIVVIGFSFLVVMDVPMEKGRHAFA